MKKPTRQSMAELERIKAVKELRKLELECIKLEEEIVAIKLKRRALVLTLIVSVVGLFIQYYRARG
ncbi:hypothetical protein ABRZ80_20415 [Vibrio vulnificus]|uniref:hypothetical protein n=1 Tax=Vibrio vulnificus TaxID=672 RepID=UPI001023CB6D|nr:hypothetical protein [Vibrio vulnificus]EHZ2651952.1 hypothetical protein [Vibrio vulnificus]RZQ33188.1 hypothetical protein D8T38_18265 [Vibrio vulnificus]